MNAKQNDGGRVLVRNMAYGAAQPLAAWRKVGAALDKLEQEAAP